MCLRSPLLAEVLRLVMNVPVTRQAVSCGVYLGRLWGRLCTCGIYLCTCGINLGRLCTCRIYLYLWNLLLWCQISNILQYAYSVFFVKLPAACFLIRRFLYSDISSCDKEQNQRTGRGNGCYVQISTTILLWLLLGHDVHLCTCELAILVNMARCLLLLVYGFGFTCATAFLVAYANIIQYNFAFVRATCEFYMGVLRGLLVNLTTMILTCEITASKFHT